MEALAQLTHCHPDNPGDSSKPRWHCNSKRLTMFQHAGLLDFEDFWNLPRNFVDAINHRRGGWSAVSRLSLSSKTGVHTFFVKRQQDQRRRSWKYPTGRLTYYYELEAILLNHSLGLPAVTVAGAGYDDTGDTRRAILVTDALDAVPLSDLSREGSDWESLLPLCKRAGELLCDMHRERISHGALYPHHLFIDPVREVVNLIDFERSRCCLLSVTAAKRDLAQFLRRAAKLPAAVTDSLLCSHRQHFPRMTNQLMKHYRAR